MTRTIHRLPLAGLLLLLLLPPSSGGAASPPACTLPPGMLTDEPVAPLTVTRLAAGEPVTIVALGGASTAGRGAGSSDLAWPARLAAALSVRYPGARVLVLNRGVGQQTARDMADRLARDVLSAAPSLVIWEAGTADAARGTDVDGFHDALQGGIDALFAKGIEVVLMDTQFSRVTEILINLERYAAEMHDIAAANGIGLFPRRDLMRLWEETGVFDYAVRGPGAQRAVVRRLYDCLGATLAEFITHNAVAGTPAR